MKFPPSDQASPRAATSAAATPADPVEAFLSELEGALAQLPEFQRHQRYRAMDRVYQERRKLWCMPGWKGSE